jgi:hypothetical protein
VTRAPIAVTLGPDQVWWRVADTSWDDPLDATYADRAGGRWNAPGDGATLYVNADLETARAQIGRMLLNTAIDPEDLRDDAPFVAVPVRLPARQRVADAVTDLGLVALGLPRSYPSRPRGGQVGWTTCRRVARAVRAARLRGVLARSAATPDGSGRELAWFPGRGMRAQPAGEARPFADWRHAEPVRA